MCRWGNLLKECSSEQTRHFSLVSHSGWSLVPWSPEHLPHRISVHDPGRCLSLILQRGNNLRSGAKGLVCDIDLLRLNVLVRIFDSVEFDFQGFSLLWSALLGESAIAPQFFSKKIFKVFQLQLEWNPVDDDATFSIFGGFLIRLATRLSGKGMGLYELHVSYATK